MARLTHSDLEAVLRVVQEVSRADADEFSRVAVTELAELVRSDALALNEVDPNAGRISYIAEPESFAPPPELSERLMQLADEHPLMRYYVSSGDGSAKRIIDFWTQEQFHASSVYQQVYRHIGVEYQMSLALPVPKPELVAMVATRTYKDFSERDLFVLNTLRPHLAQAWYNAKDQDHLRSLLRVAADAAADGGANVIVLSDPPYELTPQALVCLYRYFGRPTQTSPFPFRVERWLEHQRSLITASDSLALLKPLRAGPGKPRCGSVTSPLSRINRVRRCSERSRSTGASSNSRRLGSRHVKPRSSEAWSTESPTRPSVRTCTCPLGR